MQQRHLRFSTSIPPGIGIVTSAAAAAAATAAENSMGLQDVEQSQHRMYVKDAARVCLPHRRVMSRVMARGISGIVVVKFRGRDNTQTMWVENFSFVTVMPRSSQMSLASQYLQNIDIYSTKAIQLQAAFKKRG